MSSDDELIEVVAAAIVRNGTVLAAHRRRPSGWEFPGGKVELGESAPDALRRECREELDVAVEPGRALGVATDDRIRLTLLAATLTNTGEPRAADDHDELRWLTPADLEDAGRVGGMDWLSLDRVLLVEVRTYVAATLREMNRPGKL